MSQQRVILQSRLLQSESKIHQLQKINIQLSRIIQSTQLPQYKQLLSRLTSQQRDSSSTISNLTTRISQLQIQIEFNQSRMNSIISDYQGRLESLVGTIGDLKRKLHQAMDENNKLRKQIANKNSMLRNQEELIDDYKRSLQQQRQIQDEISRCEIKSLQTKMSKQLQHQIKTIKKHYQQKLQRYMKRNLTKQFQNEMRGLKMYLTEKKKLVHTLDKKQDRRKEENILVVEFDDDDLNEVHGGSKYCNDKRGGHDDAASVEINKVKRSLESTLQGSLLNNNYHSTAAYNPSPQQPLHNGTANFSSIDISCQFNSRQPLKEITELPQQKSNKRQVTSQKAFMTEKLRTATTTIQMRQQQMSERMSTTKTKPAQTKFQKKSNANKQNCYNVISGGDSKCK